MSTTTFSRTVSKLPYKEKLYRSGLSRSAAEILYERLHLDFSYRIRQAFEKAELEDAEQPPSAAAIAGILKLVDDVAKTEPLSFPEVSVFYGEASVVWKSNKREVTLLSRGAADDPKILYYASRENEPSYHNMKRSATAKDLKKAIRYSPAGKSGWLYES
jgi:hypothetical protein